MISFLRSIRKSLLMEHQQTDMPPSRSKPPAKSSMLTMRYLKYALGEILLVMIGILLALQVNNWNENRKTKLYEQTMLLEIKQQLILDQKMIQSWMPTLRGILHHIHEVVAIKSDPSYPADSLYTHLKAIKGFGIAISFNTSAYEGLKSGGLDKISNSKIRNLLTEIYGVSIPRTTSWINELVRESLFKRGALFNEIFDVTLVPGPEDTIISEFKLQDLAWLRSNRKLDEMLSELNWPIPITIRLMENLEQNMQMLIVLLNQELP